MTIAKMIIIVSSIAVVGLMIIATVSIVIDQRKQRIARKEQYYKKPCGPYEQYIKRPLDVVLAAGALVALSPIFVVIAVLVKTQIGSPILFIQERPGKINPTTGEECVFKLYKFRTMTDKRDVHGDLLPDDLRLTSFGKVLRSTSLDELPELINILKGDMSIIGPRPLMVEYIDYYDEVERQRHRVRPGLTGLAQINGRSYISWEEIFDYDVKYVNSINLKQDVAIFLRTIVNVIRRDNVADAEQFSKDDNGNLYVLIDGNLKKVHDALDKERRNNEENNDSRSGY